MLGGAGDAVVRRLLADRPDVESIVVTDMSRDMLRFVRHSVMAASSSFSSNPAAAADDATATAADTTAVDIAAAAAATADAAAAAAAAAADAAFSDDMAAVAVAANAAVSDDIATRVHGLVNVNVDVDVVMNAAGKAVTIHYIHADEEVNLKASTLKLKP